MENFNLKELKKIKINKIIFIDGPFFGEALLQLNIYTYIYVYTFKK